MQNSQHCACQPFREGSANVSNEYCAPKPHTLVLGLFFEAQEQTSSIVLITESQGVEECLHFFLIQLGRPHSFHILCDFSPHRTHHPDVSCLDILLFMGLPLMYDASHFLT